MNKLPQPKGWFVYCYLRTASNLPYYIGLGSRPDRMTARHSCKVPRNWSRIRVMRQGLTREQAICWERLYIARYGRKDLGTGCLMNRTDGGDATKHGPEALEKIRQAALRPENVERLRTINVGRRRPEHAIKAISEGRSRAWDRYWEDRGWPRGRHFQDVTHLLQLGLSLRETARRLSCSYPHVRRVLAGGEEVG